MRNNRRTNATLDITPDPIDELGLDDDAWRERFGVTGSLDAAIDRLATRTLAALAGRRAPLRPAHS